MHHHFDFKDVLAGSCRGAWALEDILPPDAAPDFSRRFMPESLARSASAPWLDCEERRILNQIRGHEYLTSFGLAEEFFRPFIRDHARPQSRDDDRRVRALLQFAGEDPKHAHLFGRFQALLTGSFATRCAMIGPPDAIAAEISRHDPLSVALVILMIEWMSQAHHRDEVVDDGALDPLFMTLLKHEWIDELEQVEHDIMIVRTIAEGLDAAAISRAMDGFLDIAAFLDAGLKRQAGFNLDALEQATGRTLDSGEREALTLQQHQALRWTYIGSGMVHPHFIAVLGAISPEATNRVAGVAHAFS